MADLPRSFSPSAAGTYRQCPRRWKHRYVDHLADPPGEAALLGTFAHRVLELLCEEEPAARTVDRARELARRIWPSIEAQGDFVALSLDDDARRDFRWRSWKAIEGLWALEDPSRVDVHSTEQRVRATIAGVPFMGIVDRVDNTADGLVITDYKSGRPPRPGDHDSVLSQVLLYAAAIESDSGERPARARLLYLGKEIVEAEVTDERLATTGGDLADTWSDLGRDCDADEFTTRPGPLCGWCPYVAVCEDGGAEVRRRVREGRMRADAPARTALGI